MTFDRRVTIFAWRLTLPKPIGLAKAVFAGSYHERLDCRLDAVLKTLWPYVAADQCGGGCQPKTLLTATNKV